MRGIRIRRGIKVFLQMSPKDEVIDCLLLLLSLLLFGGCEELLNDTSPRLRTLAADFFLFKFGKIGARQNFSQSVRRLLEQMTDAFPFPSDGDKYEIKTNYRCASGFQSTWLVWTTRPATCWFTDWQTREYSQRAVFLPCYCDDVDLASTVSVWVCV